MRKIKLNLNAVPVLSDADILVIKNVCDHGQLMICPTESSYLLGGNALIPEISRRIYDLKERELGKPLPIIVAHREMAARFGEMNQWAEVIAASFWPGPVTIIIPARKSVPQSLTAGKGTIGLRVSAFPLLREIFNVIDYPLISTSANLSGAAEPYDPMSFFGDFSHRQEDIGLFLDGGPLKKRKPSTIIDLTGTSPLIRRDGAVPGQTILALLDSARRS